jgi:hypothetical protein
MLDLHLSSGQGLVVETPTGDVEVWVQDVLPDQSQVKIEVVLPDEWTEKSRTTTFKLQEEFSVQAPDGLIRVKVLRFRPRPDGTGGAVSLGIDAPRSWPISR